MTEHPSEVLADEAYAVCEHHGVYPVECRWNQRTGWLLTLDNPDPEAEDYLLTQPHPDLGAQALWFEGANHLGAFIGQLEAGHPHAARLQAWWAEFAPRAEDAAFELLHLDYLPLHLDQLQQVSDLSAEDDFEVMTFLYRYAELVYHLPDSARHEAFLANEPIAEFIEAYFAELETLYTSPTFRLDAFREAMLEAVAFFRERVLPRQG
jgi:hypothetical protein